MIGIRDMLEYIAGNAVSILAIVAIIIVVTVFVVTIASYPADTLHPVMKDSVILTKTQLDEIKADAYTAGHIDGRGSILDEQSGRNHCPLGVPEGYKPSPWPEWRKYATVISNTSDSAGCTP